MPLTCGPMTETVIERDGVPIRRFVCGCGRYEGGITVDVWNRVVVPAGPQFIQLKRDEFADRLERLHPRKAPHAVL